MLALSSSLHVLALVAPLAFAQEPPTFEPFSFVHIGDPQVGYGDGAYPGARRLKQLAEAVDATGADFGIVVGDMVQDRTGREQRLLREALDAFELPLYFIPGNHDVLDRETLAEYRSAYGDDYYAFVHKQCAFLALNSETLLEPFAPEETQAQTEWLSNEVRSLDTAVRHTFLVTHRPPFTHPDHEDVQDPVVRAARAAGARHILAGHLHATAEISASDDAFTIFTVGGTARVRDERGYGYRLFRVFEDRVEQEYIVVARPPNHWLARHGWSPRLFDPSLLHWTLTLVLGAAAWACGRAARRCTERAGWGLLAFLYGLLAVNLQLDLDEIGSAVFRGGLRALGMYGERRLLQGVVLAAGALSALVVAGVWSRRARRGGRYVWLAGVGLAVPLASFALHALSLHQVDALLYTFGRAGLYAIEASGASLSIFAAWRSVRSPRSQV